MYVRSPVPFPLLHLFPSSLHAATHISISLPTTTEAFSQLIVDETRAGVATRRPDITYPRSTAASNGTSPHISFTPMRRSCGSSPGRNTLAQRLLRGSFVVELYTDIALLPQGLMPQRTVVLVRRSIFALTSSWEGSSGIAAKYVSPIGVSLHERALAACPLVTRVPFHFHGAARAPRYRRLDVSATAARSLH